jgi:hypothetical protein
MSLPPPEPEQFKILVCAHKQAEFPQSDIFLPIHCGKALSNIDLGIQGDDTGDNISAKNQLIRNNYCLLIIHNS